jgi:MFS family permease
MTRGPDAARRETDAAPRKAQAPPRGTDAAPHGAEAAPGRRPLPSSVRRLTLVLVLSATADAFALVALLWYLTVHHAGAGALGGLVLAAGLPAVASGPLIGRWLGRSPARWLLVADNLARAAVLLAIAALAAGGLLSLPVLLALAAMTGVLSPATYAGSRVLLPRLVAEPDLVRANGMLAVGDQFPLLAGPALAGPAAGLLGGTAALVIPAAALVLAGWAAAGLPAAQPAGRPGADRGAAGAQPDREAGGRQPDREAGGRQPDREAGGRQPDRGAAGAQPDRGAGPQRTGRPAGQRRRNRALPALLALTGAYYFAYGPLEPAMPLYAHQVLHSGGAGYGALWSVFGLGALLGLLAVRRLARLRPGLVNAAGTALWGAVTLPLVLTGALPAALPVMFAGGLVWGPYGAIETATIQRITPPDRHGAVFGLRRGIQVAATPAGAAIGGLLLIRLPPQAVIGLAAGSCVLVGAAALLYRPLRRLRWPAG